MATEKDKEWVRSLGPSTENPKNPLKPKDEFANELLDAKKSALKLKMIEDTLREPSNPPTTAPAAPPSTGESEKLATTIVTKSMDATDKALQRMNEATEQLRDELLKVQKEREEHLNRWIESQLERVKERQEQADRAALDAADAGVPNKQFDTFRQVKGLLKEMIDEMGISNKEKETAHPQDLRVQIELERLRNDNALALKRMDKELLDSERNFKLKLIEIEDSNKLKWREYEDKKDDFKEGRQNLREVIDVIASSIGKEREATQIANPQAIKYHATEFPCEYCKKPVSVPEGVEEVQCPNEECGAKYKVEPIQT